CTTIITVVGQCVGANDYEQAEHFIKKFTGYCYLSLLVFNTTLYFIAPNIVSLYGLSPEVSQSATEILRIFALGCIFVWVPSFLFPNALRASGDSTFTMSVSMISMWAFRIGLSYILALNLSLGLLGVWIAMLVDWAVRAIVFSIRLSGTKWKTKTIL
ncbi:MAG: MATE family efflux transporter, partial [Oscillospiraceae bacterium]